MLRRIMVITLTASMLFLSGQIFAADAISVSKIDGLDTTNGGLMANTPIRYYVHFQVGADTIFLINNGFRIYSPDGANWQPLAFNQLVMFSDFFDQLNGISRTFEELGMGADTFEVHGFGSISFGLPPGFDSNFFMIETSLSDDHIGKTLCLDSSQWEWQPWWVWLSIADPSVVSPDWDGPYCFEIVDCCVGNRGDVNGDGVGPNILDLTLLVDFVFRGAPAPNCQLESDVNGDGMPYNILDLTFVVDFVFRSGQPAPACPN